MANAGLAGNPVSATRFELADAPGLQCGVAHALALNCQFRINDPIGTARCRSSFLIPPLSLRPVGSDSTGRRRDHPVAARHLRCPHDPPLRAQQTDPLLVHAKLMRRLPHRQELIGHATGVIPHAHGATGWPGIIPARICGTTARRTAPTAGSSRPRRSPPSLLARPSRHRLQLIDVEPLHALGALGVV